MKLYEVLYEWRDTNDNLIDSFKAGVAARGHRQASDKGLAAARKEMGRKRVDTVSVSQMKVVFVP